MKREFTNYTKVPDTAEELQSIVDAAKSAGVYVEHLLSTFSVHSVRNIHHSQYVGITDHSNSLFCYSTPTLYKGKEVSYKEFLSQFRAHQFTEPTIAEFSSNKEINRVFELIKYLGYSTFGTVSPNCTSIWFNGGGIFQSIIDSSLRKDKVVSPEEFEQRLLGTHKTKTMRTLSSTDAMSIINIACGGWKEKLAKKWGANIALDKDIQVEEDFYKKMRKACTQEQHQLFDKVFGSDKPAIDYDRLRAGSRVKIRDTGKICQSIDKIKLDDPVDVVFFKTHHYILGNHFVAHGCYPQYTTFHQNGEYVLFSAHDGIDYITEVISY